MLLYVKHYGQLCNRLWALTPVLAYVLQKNKKLYVLFAKKTYLDCFPNLRTCKNLGFILSHNNSVPQSLEWRLALLSEKYNLEVKNDFRNVKNTGFFSFVDGWQHGEDLSFVKEQKNRIRFLFSPVQSVVNKVNETLNGFDGITVGVHVRRGDYKSYLGGRYYFSDDVYLSFIKKLNYIFSTNNKKVRFLICSNESFGYSHGNIDIFSIKEADGITDLYALSKCDYIIGPPSSYSQWASFVGDVPLCILLSDNMDFDISSFSKIVLFNTFENGKKIKLSNHTDSYYIE